VPASHPFAPGLALTRRPLSLLAAGVATVVLAVLERGDAVTRADEPEE